eukprot:9896082-Alexandrium_andersonii.AAC.1
MCIRDSCTCGVLAASVQVRNPTGRSNGLLPLEDGRRAVQRLDAGMPDGGARGHRFAAMCLRTRIPPWQARGKRWK